MKKRTKKLLSLLRAPGGTCATAIKTVLTAWQDRKREELRHPLFDETMPMGLVAAAQAQLRARHLRGDLDGYPAFFWK